MICCSLTSHSSSDWSSSLSSSSQSSRSAEFSENYQQHPEEMHIEFNIRNEEGYEKIDTTMELEVDTPVFYNEKYDEEQQSPISSHEPEGEILIQKLMEKQQDPQTFYQNFGRFFNHIFCQDHHSETNTSLADYQLKNNAPSLQQIKLFQNTLSLYESNSNAPSHPHHTSHFDLIKKNSIKKGAIENISEESRSHSIEDAGKFYERTKNNLKLSGFAFQMNEGYDENNSDEREYSSVEECLSQKSPRLSFHNNPFQMQNKSMISKKEDSAFIDENERFSEHMQIEDNFENDHYSSSSIEDARIFNKKNKKKNPPITQLNIQLISPRIPRDNENGVLDKVFRIIKQSLFLDFSEQWHKEGIWGKTNYVLGLLEKTARSLFFTSYALKSTSSIVNQPLLSSTIDQEKSYYPYMRKQIFEKKNNTYWEVLFYGAFGFLLPNLFPKSWSYVLYYASIKAMKYASSTKTSLPTMIVNILHSFAENKTPPLELLQNTLSMILEPSWHSITELLSNIIPFIRLIIEPLVKAENEKKANIEKIFKELSDVVLSSQVTVVEKNINHPQKTLSSKSYRSRSPSPQVQVHSGKDSRMQSQEPKQQRRSPSPQHHSGKDSRMQSQELNQQRRSPSPQHHSGRDSRMQSQEPKQQQRRSPSPQVQVHSGKDSRMQSQEPKQQRRSPSPQHYSGRDSRMQSQEPKQQRRSPSPQSSHPFQKGLPINQEKKPELLNNNLCINLNPTFNAMSHHSKTKQTIKKSPSFSSLCGSQENPFFRPFGSPLHRFQPQALNTKNKSLYTINLLQKVKPSPLPPIKNMGFQKRSSQDTEAFLRSVEALSGIHW